MGRGGGDDLRCLSGRTFLPHRSEGRGVLPLRSADMLGDGQLLPASLRSGYCGGHVAGGGADAQCRGADRKRGTAHLWRQPVRRHREAAGDNPETAFLSETGRCHLYRAGCHGRPAPQQQPELHAPHRHAGAERQRRSAAMGGQRRDDRRLHLCLVAPGREGLAGFGGEFPPCRGEIQSLQRGI